MLRNNHLYLIIHDAQGSPRVVVDAQSGAVAQRMDFDPYGRVLNDTNPGFQPFGFAGGLYDAATGLVRFGARDYNPQAGRWTSRDPIMFHSRTTNLYVYVSGDPINGLDPFGLGLPGGPPGNPISSWDRAWLNFDKSRNPSECDKARAKMLEKELEDALQAIKDWYIKYSYLPDTNAPQDPGYQSIEQDLATLKSRFPNL
jgi:RHS repeat-associated protein